MRNSLLIVRVILWRWSIKTLVLSDLRLLKQLQIFNMSGYYCSSPYSQSPVRCLCHRSGLLVQNMANTVLEKLVKNKN